MKKNIFLLFLFCLSCSKSSDLRKYFSDRKADEVLLNIIRYVYKKPATATNKTKFDLEFLNYYSKQKQFFRIEQIERLKDSTYVFLLIRPVGATTSYKRGIIGRFRLTENSTMPTEFEEIIATPHLKEIDLIERGNFLFKEYIKSQNLNKYLQMKHYIEWPDSTLIYDKKLHEWVQP